MPEIAWVKNRGQNGWDALVDVGLDQSVASRNVHLFDGGLGTRRGGSVSLTITGVTAPINALIEYIPGQDETASELFVVDSSGTTKILRCAAGAAFSNLTLADNVATAPTMVSAAIVNGKLYLAYDSTVNRLHVFDPGYSTTTIRRAGMGTTAAATVANGGGAGVYPATLRYYRIAFTEKRSGVVIRRSLLSPSVSFTPSGANLNATVTKPASLSEGETHWEVYGSADDILYYALAADITGALSAAIVVATTTYADTTAPASYASYAACPIEGSNTPFPSVKCLGTDGSRLYGLGVWETAAGDSLAPKAGRFYFGPVQDSSTVNDDERINFTSTLVGYLDLARNASAADRGVSPRPVNNIIYAFQSAGIYAISPTDASITPYRRVCLDAKIGNLAQQMIVLAHDRNGSPCVFFWDPVKGPYVVGGSDGLKWCGKDIAPLVATVNRDATTIAGWGIWYGDLGQVIFAAATGSSNTPNLAFVLDVTELKPDEDGDLRGGWTVYDGNFVAANCGVIYSNTLAATRSRVKVPYTGGNSKLLRYDTTLHQDDGVDYNAYVTSGALTVSSNVARLDRCYLMADARAGGTVYLQLLRNGGMETRQFAIVLTPSAANEAIVFKKAEDAAMQDIVFVQALIGDISPVLNHWHLYQFRAHLTAGSPL